MVGLGKVDVEAGGGNVSLDGDEVGARGLEAGAADGNELQNTEVKTTGETVAMIL